MQNHLTLYVDLMFAPGGLSRRQREMIAVVVSRENRCDYRVAHHREALARYVSDTVLLDAICSGAHAADVAPADHELMAYATKLTCAPVSVSADDLQRLRVTILRRPTSCWRTCSDLTADRDPLWPTRARQAQDHCFCKVEINGQDTVPWLAQQSRTRVASTFSMRRRSASFPRTSASFNSASWRASSQ